MLKGFGADSEEKHEPVSDIDTAVVDRLKVLDPKRTDWRSRHSVNGRVYGCTPWCARPLSNVERRDRQPGGSARTAGSLPKFLQPVERRIVPTDL